MLDALAQTYTYTTTTTNTDTGLLAGIFGAYIIVWLVVLVIMVVSMWKIFEKAGVEGWKALIPVYNYWVLCEIVGKPGWWSLAFLLYLIPVLGWFFAWIPVLIVSIIVSIELAKAFGKEPIWALLLILLPVVGYPILGFGDAKYTKPAAAKKS